MTARNKKLLDTLDPIATFNVLGMDVRIYDIESEMISGDHGTYATAPVFIGLNDSLSPKEKALTLLHELLHALFHVGGYCNENDKKSTENQEFTEEQIVDRVSAGVFTLLAHNEKEFKKHILVPLGWKI